MIRNNKLAKLYNESKTLDNKDKMKAIIKYRNIDKRYQLYKNI